MPEGRRAVLNNYGHGGATLLNRACVTTRMTWWLILILVVVVVLFVLGGLLWWGLKKGLALALNSVIGFFALYAVQAWWLHDLAINLWSVLFTAILGIFGFLLVVILHLFGIWF